MIQYTQTSRGTKVSQEQENYVAEDVSSVPAASPLPPTTAEESAVEETQKAQGGEEQGSAGAPAAPARKRSKRKTRLINVEEISPRSSYWPIVLAFSLALVLFGVIAGPIVVVVGIILAVVSAGGWILERR